MKRLKNPGSSFWAFAYSFVVAVILFAIGILGFTNGWWAALNTP